MKDISFLVVDDSSVVRHLISKYIRAAFGFDSIHTAKNGKEAFDIFQDNDIDIIISDWDMPVLSGEELLFNIRNNSKNKNVPFIMVTSHAEKDFIVTAIQNGVSYYVVKPFTSQDIERKIIECLNITKRRCCTRYKNIPAHSSFVTFNRCDIQSSVIDISLEGAQLELDYQNDILLLKQCLLNIDMTLPDTLDRLEISPIISKVVRIEACDSFNSSSKRCRLGLYFLTTSFDRAVKDKITSLINWLDSNLPEVN